MIRWRRIGPSHLVALLLAASLLVLGVPQAADSSWLLWTVGWSSLMTTKRSIPPPFTEADALALEKADAWFDDPQALLQAGLIRLPLAYAGDVDHPNSEKIARVTADLTQGLARAPANPKAWAGLAYAQLAAGKITDAKRTYRTSILLGPHETDLSLWRAELGLRLWPSLDDDTKSMVAEEIRAAWLTQPATLTLLANTNNIFSDRIMLALVPDPAATDAFLRSLMRRH